MTVDTLTDAEIRARFEMVRAGYEADGPDSTIPGASKIGRYALVIEMFQRGHGYFVTYCPDLAGVEQAAASVISDGDQPACYFDLFELAGEEPPADVGDTVELIDGGGTFEVAMVDYEIPTRELRYIGEDSRWARASECRIIARAHQDDDERMPVRYGVAKIITTVVFNTVATER